MVSVTVTPAPPSICARHPHTPTHHLHPTPSPPCLLNPLLSAWSSFSVIVPLDASHPLPLLFFYIFMSLSNCSHYFSAFFTLKAVFPIFSLVQDSFPSIAHQDLGMTHQSADMKLRYMGRYVPFLKFSGHQCHPLYNRHITRTMEVYWERHRHSPALHKTSGIYTCVYKPHPCISPVSPPLTLFFTWASDCCYSQYKKCTQLQDFVLVYLSLRCGLHFVTCS